MTQKNFSAAEPRILGLTVGSIGVVYGDIGTSPLYAFRESLHAASGHTGLVEPATVLGILSLILWSLFIIVTLKYVIIILRADNHGEGGILSLMALAQAAIGTKTWLTMLGIGGCALFFGDAIITPAISILSAVEGLSLVTSKFTPYVIPLALAIIIPLFIVQSRGTSKIAKFFGPIMVLWFVAMAIGGILHIGDQPEIWRAINPVHGFNFMMNNGYAGFIALGAVVLSITGAEALYADLGHFGKKPIRRAWTTLVAPALVLNYFGQGALVLSHPETAKNSFFLLYPDWALLPMVILATFATIIASQAVITGAFSLAHQAIQLGLLPRLDVQYKSRDQAGQIYIPQVNWLLLFGVLLLIEIFKSSSSLAAAYGIAVTGTMVITAIIAFVVLRYHWRWSLLSTILVIAPFFIIDFAFLSANMLKFFHGGYMPVLVAAMVVLFMSTWVRGSQSLTEQSNHQHTMLNALLKKLEANMPQRVEGTAFYLTSSVEYAPSALLQNLKHNKVLHERNIFLTLRFENRPHVPEDEQFEQEMINSDFFRIYMNFGYMDPPNVLEVLSLWNSKANKLDIDKSTFFISRRNIVPSLNFGMPVWRDRIYIAMANNSSDAADYFGLPQQRVVELGVQMTI